MFGNFLQWVERELKPCTRLCETFQALREGSLHIFVRGSQEVSSKSFARKEPERY